VRLRAREEQIYQCYAFSTGPFARYGFSRLIHDTDSARAGFQEARRTHCGASGAECAHNERETRGSQGRMRRGWGRGEGYASEVARPELQEQRSFICNEIEDRLHQAAPRD